MTERNGSSTAQRPGPKVRLRLDLGIGRIGPGKIDLLEAVGRTGSVADAARSMGMSYRRAWLLISAVNAMFEEAAVLNPQGGGATLTPFGARLVAAFRAIEGQARATAAEELHEIMGRLAKDRD